MTQAAIGAFKIANEYVDQGFALAQSYADSSYNKANDSVNALLALLSSLHITLSNVTPVSATMPEMHDLPDAPTEPTLGTVSYIVPTAPGKPTFSAIPAVSIEDSPSSLDFLQYLQGRIKAVAAGEGLIADEAAFRAGRKRLQQAREDELVALEDKFAALGDFTPSGAYFAARQSVVATFADKLETLILGILVDREKASREILSLAQAAAQIELNWYNSLAQRLADVAIKKAELGIKVVQAEITQWEAEHKVFMAQLDEIKTRVGLVQSLNDGLIKVYQAQVSAFSEKVKAISSYDETAAKMYSTEMEMYIKKAELAIEEATKNQQLYLQMQDTIAKGLEALAQITSQMAASALNAIHVSAGVSGSGSASDSVSNSGSSSHSVSESTVTTISA